MALTSREQMIDKLNQANLAGDLVTLRAAILNKVVTGLIDGANGESNDPQEREKQDKMLLNSVGPAAAAAAIEYAFNEGKRAGKLNGKQLTSNYIENYKLVANDTSSLRQFLLPRYAYLDFDNMVDPRHQIDNECGYPKYITPLMFRYMYDRDDVACRVVDIYPDESWAVDPLVYEEEDEEKTTPFEEAWNALCEDHNLLQILYRMDKLAGVGHYGVLLLGVQGEEEDGDLEKPINEAALLRGDLKSVSSKKRNLLYLRPFDEYLSFIQKCDTNVNSPRYGLPEYYNLVFMDMSIDAAGSSIGTRQNKKVHWSRVVHVADNQLSSLVFGKPRQQSCFNRLLDLRKIKGSSAEMFWKGGFPGISFEINPEFAADSPDYDEEALKDEIERYSSGLQRYLRTMGVTAKSMAPAVADPKGHVSIQMAAIASHIGVPLRVFLGSEEGRLASSQDKLTWNQRLRRRLRTFVEPNILRNLINRFIAIGILPKPKKLVVEWSDLNTLTDEDKANLSLKWTQALSQYVSTGIIHMIRPMDYMTTVLGLMPSQAKKIIATIEKEGGWGKLLKVDPSQGAGVNGKRENITKKDSNKERGARKKRNPATKKAEGTAS